MKIVITLDTAINGATVKYPEDKVVYKFEADDLDGLQEMLFDIKEQVQPPDSKYNKERVFISREHGSGWKCKDKKNCTICQR